MKNTISVIVPVYNSEKYIRRCLNSILAQTYTDLEIILVDDGSTDSSGVICDEFAEKDSRIIVLHKPNGGQAAARNVGLDTASGEYIGFIDSDDYIHPEMYETLISVLKKNTECDFSMISMKKVSDNEMPEKFIEIQSECKVLNKFQLWDMCYNGNYTLIVSCCVKLIKRSSLGKLRFPSGRFKEDSFFLTDMLSLTEKAVYCNLPMYYYFQNDNSSERRISAQSVVDGLESIKFRLQTLEKIYPQILNTGKSAYKKRYYFYIQKMLNMPVNEKKRLRSYFKKSFFKDMRAVNGVISVSEKIGVFISLYSLRVAGKLSDYNFDILDFIKKHLK